MATKSIINDTCKFVKLLDPNDYPRLMIGKVGNNSEKTIFFMTSPAKGICLTNHNESYYGVQTLIKESLEDFDGSIKLFNKH